MLKRVRGVSLSENLLSRYSESSLNISLSLPPHPLLSLSLCWRGRMCIQCTPLPPSLMSVPVDTKALSLHRLKTISLPVTLQSNSFQVCAQNQLAMCCQTRGTYLATSDTAYCSRTPPSVTCWPGDAATRNGTVSGRPEMTS